MRVFNNKAGTGPIEKLDVLEESINYLGWKDGNKTSHISNYGPENKPNLNLTKHNGVEVQQLPDCSKESYTINIRFISSFIQ